MVQNSPEGDVKDLHKSNISGYAFTATGKEGQRRHEEGMIEGRTLLQYKEIFFPSIYVFHMYLEKQLDQILFVSRLPRSPANFTTWWKPDDADMQNIWAEK